MANNKKITSELEQHFDLAPGDYYILTRNKRVFLLVPDASKHFRKSFISGLVHCWIVWMPCLNVEVAVFNDLVKNAFQTKMWRYDLDKFGAKLLVRTEKNCHSERK